MVTETGASLPYRPAPGTIPESPGVYRFRDTDGRVIYVGKAKSLRQRLNSYFADPTKLHPRTYQMVHTATSVDWVVLATEVEALQLEYTWIKKYDPRFNVMYRDDKSYPYLAVTLDEEYPRLQVMRGDRRKGVRYFGPYSHAWAIRETLDLLLRVFPARTCGASVFNRARKINRPCLLGDIGKCAAPCVGRVSAAEHREIVDEFCAFMAGKTDTFVKRVEAEMHEASEALDFERAARRRDDLAALHRALEKQLVVLAEDKGTDIDVVEMFDDELQAAVQVFHVRGGRVTGQRGWIVDKPEGVTDGDLVHSLCTQFYGGRSGKDIPKEVLVPALPEDATALTDWLSELRGSKVGVRIPQRGDKKALAETVKRNAEQALVQHKLKRASDLTTRGKALEELAEALDLPGAPLRIECFDVSQMQGTDVVASMVVFEDGLPRKAEYRRFVVRGERTDDLASMHEVLTRRLSKVDESAPLIDEDGKKRRFAYPPQLLVVDGGAPQVAVADNVLAEQGIDTVNVCGLAKRLEEVWLPGEEYPVILPRRSEALYLLQRVRDEAHRFAISLHRKRRGKKVTASALDSVPGLGPTRRKALLRHFGSVKKIREATVDEIAEVTGIGPALAATITASLTEGATPTAAADQPETVAEGDKPEADARDTEPRPSDAAESESSGTEPSDAVSSAEAPVTQDGSGLGNPGHDAGS
ncbi:excinuclease ABC subunit UvrC [Stackebrandtia nassauensis]|uniref:excinuclease ABC subunit UvrC n=1 Tax=Stackebrandtia nassauensis TaxID=283811 RepID=UPI0002E7B88C|nr:excinuclease ABC subunit UvrC [Stackebrandtia nassauensis]